jgi:excisionase family DNA binding protein
MNSKQAEQELLTIRQAAARMCMSERHVRRLVGERRIPFHRLGRSIRLSINDIDGYVDAGRVEAMTEADVWRGARGVW